MELLADFFCKKKPSLEALFVPEFLLCRIRLGILVAGEFFALINGGKMLLERGLIFFR
jgi:hypothetical protein